MPECLFMLRCYMHKPSLDLFFLNWLTTIICFIRALGKGMKMAGRAVTVRMVPQRPDITADKPAGMDSPEYDAFEQATPNEVICISSVGPWESVGGDIKFLRLQQLKVGGLVTDGSVRDTDILLGRTPPLSRK